MSSARNQDQLKWLLMLSALYVSLWLLTTHIVSVGTGGLTGPLKARVYQSEYHLVAFYPLYLLESWTRNLSFTHFSYRFGCDFADGTYCQTWLYGDGKYSMIWYAAPQFLGAFILGTAAFTGLGKLRRIPWFLSLPLGLICSTLAIFAYLSSIT